MISQDEFAKLILDALRHYYDVAHLQPHALGDLVLPSHAQDDLRAQGIREVILAAIETIKPAPVIPYGSREWLPHVILKQRYVEGWTKDQVCQEHSISERSYYRYRREAIDSVSLVLWDRYKSQASSEKADANQSSSAGLRREATRLLARSVGQTANVAETIASVNCTVQALLTARGNTLQSRIFGAPTRIPMMETILRQIILQGILLLNGRTTHSTINLTVHGSDESVGLEFCAPSIHEPLQEVDVEMIRALAEALRGDVRVDPTLLKVVVSSGRKETILVLDDDQDVLPLLQRYLGAEYTVHQALDGQQFGKLLEVETPSIILLDILMPDTDGWQVLRQLQIRGEAEHIPIIVCSVLGDQNAELALALGAGAVLPKPFKQEELVATIRCLSSRSGTQAQLLRSSH